jgi:hypothetical protein
MTPSLSSLYIAELRSNETTAFNLRIGYLGACVSMNTTTTTANTTSTTTNSSSDPSPTHCISNPSSFDLDDLSEEFTETFTNLSPQDMTFLSNKLNSTLPVLQHLQKNVFSCAAPIAHVVLFGISAIIHGVAVGGGSSKRRAYKGILFLAIAISAFALALAFVTTLGSAAALNAVVEGDGEDGERLLAQQGVWVGRAKLLKHFQGTHVASVVIFYALMGGMYTWR